MTTTDMSNSGFAAALRRLPSAQKSAKGAPAYSRFVNRKAGGYLAAAAFLLKATPNQVTAVSAACTFGGIIAISTAAPSWPLGIAVSLALLVGYALDSADGQLARLRGTSSIAGEWLDHVIDSAKIATLHLAVLICAFRFFDLPSGFLLVPLGYAAVETVMFFAMILNDQLRRAHRAVSGALPPTGRPPSTLRSVLVLPTDYGVLCLAFLLLGSPVAFSVGYGALFLFNAAFLVAALPKWFGDMAGLDRAAGAPERGR
ncbi:CDP-alcohol phosphatidyltransferase family protein [Saccharopolyspora phatthalungensis]|uniref:Phosphatidylglycerophosphate synthase n=1 Tax=Saccharopolyspora phatthalungensis TaxID=664693 RepID=A0A840QEV5_9PSEU|nr:CDP-alcohol phosphatidyltransferase family protein [Saccharopolyspora phatthalungensis]MBB5158567.1 phosphatidylglycerophosphate synthase [Saccharopolyspora phatthalungensis]